MSWEVWAKLATAQASQPFVAARYLRWCLSALCSRWQGCSNGSLSLQVEAELLLESQVRQGWVLLVGGQASRWPARQGLLPWKGLAIQNPIRPVQFSSYLLLQALDQLQHKVASVTGLLPQSQAFMASSPHKPKKPTSLSQMLQRLQAPAVAQAPRGRESCKEEVA